MSNQTVNKKPKFFYILKKNIMELKFEMFLSLLALGVSGYTLWDNTFRAKIDVSPGRQVDLFVGSNELSPIQPSILMNIAFTNSGGKLVLIDDVKLIVDFKRDNQLLLNREFVAVREIKNSIIDISEMSGENRGISEVSPIVILGKTSVLKKYWFFPTELVYQNQIPEKFDLFINILIKQNGKWTLKKDFYISNNYNIWKDLDSLIHKSSIRDIEFSNK
jgi:hypothetical protein